MNNFNNNATVNQNVEVKSAFQMNVERQIRNSLLLPTMCYREAKKYLGTLESRMGTCKNQERNEEMQMQLLELCMILGVKAEDSVRRVQEIRLDNSRLNCGLDELPTYVRLLQEQVQDMEKNRIQDQLAQQATKIIKAQLREASYVLNV